MAKKNNKRKNKKKLSSLVLMLFMTGFMLTLATYAWFTSNKTVTISTLDVNVAAQNGLQISADGTTWKTVLQKTDITTGYTDSGNNIPDSLEPVSTGKTVTGGKLNMFYGTVGTNSGGYYTLTSTAAAENSGKYIVFDMFLKTDAATDLYMTTASSVVATADDNDLGLQNASRVAFVVEGSTDSSSSLDTIRGLSGGTSATTYIWEPNYDQHTANAVSHARDTYSITTTSGGGATAIAYDGVISAFDGTANAGNGVLVGEANATNYSSYFATVNPDYKTIKSFPAYQKVFSLSKGVTKVRVYMWVEGQDVDCENSASGTDISYNLQFSTNTSAS